METDIIKSIAKMDGISNAFILTHNIDYVFIQTVVLSALRQCGHPSLTIFADDSCASEAYQRQQKSISNLGSRYRVVKVPMPFGYKFHPKAILLSGPERCSLFVGSGNLSFGGWRDNAEIWNHFQLGKDPQEIFGEFRKFLLEISNQVILSDVIEKEIEEAFDPKGKPWAKDLPLGNSLMGRVGKGDSILSRMRKVIGQNAVEKLIICSPYFDDSGFALKEIINIAQADTSEVYYQAGPSTLTAKACTGLSKQTKILDTGYRRKNEKEKPFIHAKFYAFCQGEKTRLFLGSANCSRAGLTSEGSSGNAELMVVQEVNTKSFLNEIKGHLLIGEKPIRPNEILEPAIEEEPIQPALKILAARFDGQCLYVGYQPSKTVITSCLFDGVKVEFEKLEENILRVSSRNKPNSLQLIGEIDGQNVESAPSWIDDENELKVMASNRSLVDEIQNNFIESTLDIDGLVKILQVFSRHLSYIPQRSSVYSDKGSQTKVEQNFDFTAEEMLVSSHHKYRINVSSILEKYSLSGPDLLKSILLGLTGQEKRQSGQVENSLSDEIISKLELEKTEDGDVDSPEEISVEKIGIKNNDPGLLRRLKKTIQRTAITLTGSDYYLRRPADLIGNDLQFLFALVTYGLRYDWIDEKDFLEITNKIWASMFLACETDAEKGWLSYRIENEGRDFIQGVQSDDMAAALVTWSINALGQPNINGYTQFLVSLAISYSEYPILWIGNDLKKSWEKIETLMAIWVREEDQVSILVSGFKKRWRLLRKQGQALRSLEKILSGMSFEQIGSKVKQKIVKSGEILRQGKLGFYISLKGFARDSGERIKAVSLRNPDLEKQFKADSTIPIFGLLGNGILPKTKDFGWSHRETLLALLEAISGTKYDK